MWNYRELIKNLTIAEFKNRYQNTSLGFFWSILSPLLLALVLYVVFRSLNGGDKNFSLNLLVGIMTWRFFAVGTATSLHSIVSRASLVTKVFIPRQILVLSTALSALLSSVLEFVILLPIIAILLHTVPITTLLFPVFHIIYLFFIFGLGTLLASFYVYFRDLNEIWEVLLNILFFASPIIYPLSAVPGFLLNYYKLNPVTQFMGMYRSVMVAGTLPSLESVVIVVGISAIVFFLGQYAFGRLQRRFAEEI
jgi:lipopolysaccharide transport system permease protein